MIEISVKGQWVKVPGFHSGDHTVITTGGSLKTARVHDEAWMVAPLEDPEACLAELVKTNADLFTFAQMPPETESRYKFHCEPDSIAVAKVEDYRAWWESLPQETRKNTRRSAREGVTVEIRPLDDALVADLVKLNNTSPLRQGRPYSHYGKSFEQVKKDHISFVERSEFLCAMAGDELIGYVKLVFRGPKLASILNILVDEKHRDKRPVNALMTKAAERAHQTGRTHLTYGFFHHGNKRDESITLLKVRYGFKEVMVPRYYVPLTMKGKLALAAGLHRGLLFVLPNKVLTTAVDLRSKWYNFKTSRHQASNPRTSHHAGVAQ
jgi:ribosomal protein S18 acetylase RimI-like enzyme